MSPLAPKLPRQAVSGGMGYVDGWPWRTSAEKFSAFLDTGDSTPILLMIVLPFYSHSTDESTPILPQHAVAGLSMPEIEQPQIRFRYLECS